MSESAPLLALDGSAAAAESFAAPPPKPKRKKKSGKSPTQLTLAELRRRGYELVQVVEHWNPFARRRVDLFGIADVVAVGVDIVCVQTTTDPHVKERITKILESNALPPLRRVGIRVLVHGWKKRGREYVLREVDLS